MRPCTVSVFFYGVMLCTSMSMGVSADQLTVYPAKKIITMDPAMPTATALAERDDRVDAHGTMDTLQP